MRYPDGLAYLQLTESTFMFMSRYLASALASAGPVAADLRDTDGGLGAQALDQTDCALITPGRSQIHAFKFLGSPAHCVDCHEISRLLHDRDGLVYNEMSLTPSSASSLARPRIRPHSGR